ncbi:DUF4429 domain-containing protein [Phytohabitans rumicis]|uniref:SHOCT domain-containing protein n=1 Tax=Phytohabitans rumicis TaxID=1076125 RepID=A0A6V8LPR8_9ACTN|nr:DUF4429 domain-containing protein [Phytohabitans rumicis]GFJ96097.1 hypothetical protein Prum_097390 [Phytohabitans rumicis]
MTTRQPTDAERQHYARALHDAVAAGSLDLAGFDRLLAAVLHADRLEEIERLTSELPVGPFRMEVSGAEGTAVLERDRIVLQFDRALTQSVKKARSPRVIPLPAIASVEYEPKRSGVHVRFRLVGEAPDYRRRDPERDANTVTLWSDRREEAEAFVAEVRQRILLEPRTPDPQLLPPQARVPGLAPPPRGELFVQLRTFEGTVTLDENGVLLDFQRGPKRDTRRWLPLTAIAAVEFTTPGRWRAGSVRFVLAGLPAGYRPPEPKRDHDAFVIEPGREEGEGEDLAAHVAARITGPRVVEPGLLPGNDPAHWPAGAHEGLTRPAEADTAEGETGDVPGQLRELARLRAEGILTDAEYEAKKRDLLGRW